MNALRISVILAAGYLLVPTHCGAQDAGFLFEFVDSSDVGQGGAVSGGYQPTFRCRPLEGDPITCHLCAPTDETDLGSRGEPLRPKQLTEGCSVVCPAGCGMDCTITMTLLERIDGSGGHWHSVHTQPVPEGAWDPESAQLIPPPSNPTLGNVWFPSEYVGSIAGGREKWRATIENCTNCPDGSADFFICTGYLDMQPVPINPTVYALVGGESDKKHFPNSETHYLQPPFMRDIAAAADSFHRRVPTIRLRINDGSLELGGIFDISGDWGRPHKYHRRGLDVDVGVWGFAAGADTRVDLNTAQKTLFMALASRMPNVAKVEIHSKGTSNEHFHVYGRK